jgi:hypothetical protein
MISGFLAFEFIVLQTGPKGLGCPRFQCLHHLHP